MKKIFVKTSKKTNGVVEILWAGLRDGQESLTTPEELKPTLNMFRGRQFPACFKDLLKYAEVSLRVQEGNVEAERELHELNVSFNRSEDYEG